MGYTLTEKIIKDHLVSGEMVRGEKISIHIDQTLTQDATGTMAYLELEALGVDKIKTDFSVSYVDHNTLQTGFENADDHAYLRSVADKYGVIFSKAGNGICHQVNLERYSRPTKTLLGSDSHTPTCGGAGMLAIGAGGMDVALAMAGEPFSLLMPKIVKIELVKKLKKGVSAKDIILKVLEILTVKGGVNKVIEYTGSGVSSLSVPERATICNMGAELGATSSIFPSDEITKEFFKKEERLNDFTYLYPDSDAVYDEEYTIDLDSLEPLAACPHSPDNIQKIVDLQGKKVNQVLIGSCTNSSYRDLAIVASILKGHRVHPDVSLGISPGSHQVYSMIARDGILKTLIDAGARILESTCGPCIGMGQSPQTDAVSLRTFNRNFYGRSGTMSANVYLVSPEVAASSAITGCITLPGDFSDVNLDVPYIIDDLAILPTYSLDIKRGPNITPIPVNEPLPKIIDKRVCIKVPDNITTDHIMPAGAKVLPYRSNINKISDFVFYQIDPDFKKRCLEYNGGFIIGGANYGQGSSREHAALAPMYLGIKAVIVKSFARIHKKNLINFGIIPFTFLDEADYDKIDLGDELVIDLEKSNYDSCSVFNKTKNYHFTITSDINETEKAIIEAGGILNHIKNKRM